MLCSVVHGGGSGGGGGAEGGGGDGWWRLVGVMGMGVCGGWLLLLVRLNSPCGSLHVSLLFLAVFLVLQEAGHDGRLQGNKTSDCRSLCLAVLMGKEFCPFNPLI